MANLDRFLEMHKCYYEVAIEEIKNGRKQSHWMWFIFPQLKGLGSSWMAEKYAIEDRKEAREYLNNPILYCHLLKISEELLKLETNDINDVFDFPDDLKLKSCMTLFYLVSRGIIFKMVLDKFFNGEMCEYTLYNLDD